MRWTTPPSNRQSLDQRLRNLQGAEAAVQRRRVTMSLVVVGQMLPEGAIKGGSAMALRFGLASRFTRDLDAARVASLDQFRADSRSHWLLGGLASRGVWLSVLHPVLSGCRRGM